MLLNYSLVDYKQYSARVALYSKEYNDAIAFSTEVIIVVPC